MSCEALLGLSPCVGFTVPAAAQQTPTPPPAGTPAGDRKLLESGTAIQARLTARLLGLLAAGLVVLGFCPASAGAFECPAPQDQHGPGLLGETPAQVHGTASLLASGDAGNRVPEIVADLRKRHPGVQNAEIMNYLVAAYCPVVARLSGLGDAEKQSQVDQFAEQAGQVVDRR